MTTRPLKFTGESLRLNFSTSAVGSIRVEIQNIDGRPIDGFTLDACSEIYGDQLDAPVAWRSGTDVSALAGKPIRLRLVLRDVDLYAFRFSPAKP